MRPKVFLDTNCVSSTSFSTMIGGRGEVAYLASMADIVLADIVVEEILAHKRRHFREKQLELGQNPLIRHYGIDCSAAMQGSFEDIEAELLKDDSIRYETWTHSNPELMLGSICKLAIGNRAPFQQKTDKGFKDACVALVAEDYAIHHKDERVIFVSADNRAREYFSESEDVECFSSVEDLATSLRKETASEEKAAPLPVESESTLLPSSIAASDVHAAVEDLCHSRSFSDTHDAIARLESHYSLIDSEDAARLLKATIENSQIRMILTDEDVRRFVRILLGKHGACLPDEEYCAIVDGAHLINDRLDPLGNHMFSLAERKAYGTFIDLLVSNVQSRDYGSYVERDYSAIEPTLKRQLALSAVDKKATSWSSAAAAFIAGGVNASSNPIDADALRRFLNYMDKISESKREAVIDAIRVRLEAVEYDLPF